MFKSKSIQFLILFGLSLNIKSIQSSQAQPENQKTLDLQLFQATEKGDLRRMEALINHGANVNARPKYCMRPICVAIMNQNLPGIQLLINKGTDLTYNTLTMEGPLMIQAVETKNLNIIDYFITCGVNINAQDPNTGDTPIHKATKINKPDIVELLIKRGANIHIKDYAGNTPIYTAINQHYPELIDLLLWNNADLDSKNFNGDSAKNLALRRGLIGKEHGIPNSDWLAF
jgi:uncharacterized protein